MFNSWTCEGCFEFLNVSVLSLPSWSSGLHTASPGTQPEGDSRQCDENYMMSHKIREEGQEGPAHFKSEGKFYERAWSMVHRRETGVPVGSQGRRLAWLLIEMAAFKSETK